MRLIDADALTKEIEDFNCKDCNHYNYVRCRACPIDDAVTYIDEAPTVGEWISVEDRLPEEPGKYIVYIPPRYTGTNSTIKTAWFTTSLKSSCLFGYAMDDKDDRPGFYNSDGEGDWAEDRLTYWMPLPKAPED